MPASPTAPVLLYDGTCGFCQAVVAFILRHEKRHDLRFAPRQGAFGAAILTRHPELQGIDSVVWIEPDNGIGSERTSVRADAALQVAAYLGGWWRSAAIARLLPRLWRDALYNLIARHRRRIPASTLKSRPTPDRLLN
jgi:predicted DCC family thiol-disulfide oxidoreductase YuxK